MMNLENKKILKIGVLLPLSGEFQDSQNGIGLFLPVVSVVLLVLANKAIKKDEALIKSIDRLR